jgi:hypothetical protein
MARAALLALVLLSVAPCVALAASNRPAACVSIGTPPQAGLALGDPRRGAPRSLVLCVTRATPAPQAIRSFASAACRGEWKATKFAFRFGGGDYTTLRGCMAYKAAFATAGLARAKRFACAARLTPARVWSQSSRLGFGIWVLDGRC